MNEIKAIPTSEMKAKSPHGTDASVKPPSLRSLRVEAEAEAIRRTLEYTGWNRRRAAQLLSISYRGILYKIRQHNLTPCARVQTDDAVPMLKADSQG
jgi:two-component system, NtrC family, response regulator AtoC